MRDEGAVLTPPSHQPLILNTTAMADGLHLLLLPFEMLMKGGACARAGCVHVPSPFICEGIQTFIIRDDRLMFLLPLVLFLFHVTFLTVAFC